MPNHTFLFVPPHRQGVELSAYMAAEGFNIVPISNEHQLAYACNVLNLGDSRIISVHPPSARQIVKCPHFKVCACVSVRCWICCRAWRC
jgi:N-dimethylarginine dimethylaminohydrolase